MVDESPNGEIRILILEDCITDAELIERDLRKGGLEFTAKRVERKEDFEAALTDFAPDLILSDFKLPSFDGISAMRFARNEKPDTPFIFVTGEMGEEVAINTLRDGATDYVLKHRLSRLVPAVYRALEEAEAHASKRAAEGALKESEATYRTILESTGTTMFIVDREEGVSLVNHEFERMTGRAAGEIVGKTTVYDFLLDDGGGHDRFRKLRGEALSGDRDGPLMFEGRMRNGRGETLDVLVSMGRLPGEESIVLSLIDVTMEKVYEQELKDRAQQMSDFLGVASHELRHPITIIKGYSMMLPELMDDFSKESVLEIYSLMNDAADRLTRLVEELLDISRIDRGDFVLEPDWVELGPLISEALGEFKVRGIEVELRVSNSSGVDSIYIDRQKLIQLMIILVENAVSYSPDGCPVEVEVAGGGGGLRFSVLDRGPGVPPEVKDLIFDRFFQVEDVMHHSKAGLGLGLYIARTIVDAFGGRIWTESRDGGGSIFSFEILPDVRP